MSGQVDRRFVRLQVVGEAQAARDHHPIDCTGRHRGRRAGFAAASRCECRRTVRRALAPIRRFRGGPLGRFLVQAAHHAPQLAHPEMQTDLEKGPQRTAGARVLAAARHRDQGAEAVQHAERLPVVRHRKAVAEARHEPGHRRRSAVEHPEQVDECRVLAQAVREPQPPRVGREVALDGCTEEQLVLRSDVRLDRRMPRRIHARCQLVGRMQVPADHRAAEEGVDALTDLADDRPRLERLVEDAGDVGEQLRLVAVVTERGRRPGADQLAARAFEPHAQTPDQAREVRPLGAVERVQLVDHQVAQRVRCVVTPEPVVERPDQQIVQHLVVRQQDVRRPLAQPISVRDDVVRTQRLVRRALRLVVASDEDPRRHLPAQGRRPVDRLRDAPRLVGRQRVHRVDEDGLDPRRPGLRTAVAEDRIQKALGLAGSGAGGDDGRLSGAGGETRECRPLMAVRSEPERHVRERLAALGRLLERQGDGEERSLGEVFRIRQEVVDDVGQRGVGRPEAGREEVTERAGDLGGDDGGDHRDFALGSPDFSFSVGILRRTASGQRSPTRPAVTGPLPGPGRRAENA